jgi:SAM-dependent methyltransferase
MEQDRIRWNKKHGADYSPTGAASAVERFYTLAPGKSALDIAAGNGRNALFLAQKGFSVDAVDISEVGLAKFAGSHPDIQAVCADLDDFEIPADRYDLILNIKFLNRRLYSGIQAGLKPEGVLIFHTLLASNRTTGKAAHCRDYLLRKNELLHAFSALRIVYYRESEETQEGHGDATATLVGIKEKK